MPRKILGEAGSERMREFLTTREVAELLGVHTRAICLWAELGEIPAFRTGRQWRFRRGEVASWLYKARNSFPRSLGGRAESACASAGPGTVVRRG